MSGGVVRAKVPVVRVRVAKRRVGRCMAALVALWGGKEGRKGKALEL